MDVRNGLLDDMQLLLNILPEDHGDSSKLFTFSFVTSLYSCKCGSLSLMARNVRRLDVQNKRRSQSPWPNGRIAGKRALEGPRTAKSDARRFVGYKGGAALAERPANALGEPHNANTTKNVC